MREMDSFLLEKGLMTVQKGLERSMEKGALSNNAKEEALGKLSSTLLMEDLKDCGLIIEDVFDYIEVKKIYSRTWI